MFRVFTDASLNSRSVGSGAKIKSEKPGNRNSLFRFKSMNTSKCDFLHAIVLLMIYVCLV